MPNNPRKRDFAALLSDAPGAIPGTLPTARHAQGRDRVVYSSAPESPTVRLRENLYALAADAPGALPGSVGCCCPPDRERGLLDIQEDCGKHGDDLRRYLYLMGVQRERTTARLHRPRSRGVTVRNL